MKRWALVVLGGCFLAGCGGERTPEAPAPALPPSPPAIPEVTDLDSFTDSVPLDTLAAPDADTLEAAPLPDPGPSFAPFLTEFKVALQKGTARQFASGVAPEDLGAVLDDPAVRQRVLAAAPDRYRREGTRREVYVVVGYDRDGNVVPEDEAETESAVGLVFDVVDGAYRLVRVERAG